MESNNKKTLAIVLIIVVALLFGVVAYLYISKDKKPSVQEPTISEETTKIKRELYTKKEYVFDGKKLELTFNTVYKYTKPDEDTDPKDIVDGYVLSEKIFAVDISLNGEVLFKDYVVSEYIDEENLEEDLKASVDSFIYYLDHFDDVNGKKYLLVTNIHLDGSGKSILDLDSKKELFSFSHEDLEYYDHNHFDEAEKILKVDLSNYFKNNRKDIIINNNEIGYFKVDTKTNEFYYMKLTINNGELVTNKTVIKKLTEEEDFEFPRIYDTFDRLELEGDDDEE
ncbi:MAG: hypothetical protein IKR57_00670 [Bacilli bacterium]|nr:hypothetical protein [Bacilli bacterium]